MYPRVYGCMRAPVACIPACGCGRVLVHECACVCARAAAQRDRATARCVSPCVYVYVGVHACAYVCTCRFPASLCLEAYKNTCVCRWLGIDGRASVYLDNVYVHITIFIPIIYLLCTHTYACMWVCTDTLRTQVSMRTCAQADATRIDGCTCIQSPSIHLNI